MRAEVSDRVVAVGGGALRQSRGHSGVIIRVQGEAYWGELDLVVQWGGGGGRNSYTIEAGHTFQVIVENEEEWE